MSYISGITVLGIPAEMYLFGTQYWMSVTVEVFVNITMIVAYLPIFYTLQITSSYEGATIWAWPTGRTRTGCQDNWALEQLGARTTGYQDNWALGQLDIRATGHLGNWTLVQLGKKSRFTFGAQLFLRPVVLAPSSSGAQLVGPSCSDLLGCALMSQSVKWKRTPRHRLRIRRSVVGKKSMLQYQIALTTVSLSVSPCSVEVAQL
uniref:Uncharacterized protein n=1 Tax=Timema shepardi TaxID=629360 RepID=A0A7R9B4L2_TIMSH|nr:unnamed protein product [Timema shepardi]